MSEQHGARPLADLVALFGGEVRGGDPSTPVRGVAPLHLAGPDHVAFYSNPAYRKHLAGCRAAAIIVGPVDAALGELAGKTLLLAAQPYAAFARVSRAFHPPRTYAAGIDGRALVEPGAEVDPSARVEAFAVVKAGARVAARAVVRSGAFVGEGAQVGEDSVLHPNAVVQDGCVVGARCTLHPGAVVGADGFGFAFDPDGGDAGPVHLKVPQAGIARLEDDVELGANSCVDRATLGETVVGRGSKIDNLVQLAHNVRLGPLCLIAAQTGIAGSTTLGAGVVMGGQVGVVGHVDIGDMARFGAQSGVTNDVPAGATVAGTPSMGLKDWLRASAVFRRLPELHRELRELRRRIAALEGGN